MTRGIHQLTRLLALIIALALVAAACGSDDDGATDIGVSADEGDAPDVFVDVEGPGTGDGFKKFCAGESDISDAFRSSW